MTGDEHLYGTDLFGDPVQADRAGALHDQFIFPPFSVFDARGGDWNERKRAWKALGIESEVGRSDDLLFGDTSRVKMFDFYRKQEAGVEIDDDTPMAGTSIFDPVLCELIYEWWTRKGSQVLDPFAGGSVRGIVASTLGRYYTGIDLRPEQVESNSEQGDRICPDNKPVYIIGDSQQVLYENIIETDFVFSCPPYGDLEVYSDLPADLSNMTLDNFHYAYKRIINLACRQLHRDRFACFVVGDYRDKAGHLQNLISATITAFQHAGLKLYNHAILLTPVGTAALRASRQFNGGRKLCGTHQHVLVFVKGDWKAATAYVSGESA